MGHSYFNCPISEGLTAISSVIIYGAASSIKRIMTICSAVTLLLYVYLLTYSTLGEFSEDVDELTIDVEKMTNALEKG